MSLFNDNITNELEYIRLAKRYMTERVKCTVHDYVESEFNNIITNHDSSFVDEETEMLAEVIQRTYSKYGVWLKYKVQFGKNGRIKSIYFIRFC